MSNIDLDSGYLQLFLSIQRFNFTLNLCVYHLLFYYKQFIQLTIINSIVSFISYCEMQPLTETYSIKKCNYYYAISIKKQPSAGKCVCKKQQCGCMTFQIGYNLPQHYGARQVYFTILPTAFEAQQFEKQWCEVCNAAGEVQVR